MLLNKRFIFVVVLFLLHQSLSFAQQSEKLYLKLGFEGSYSQRKDNGNTFSTALSDGKDSVFSEKLSTNGETKEYSGKLNLDLLYKINRKNTFSFYFSQSQLKNQNSPESYIMADSAHSGAVSQRRIRLPKVHTATPASCAC